ncbi:Low Affinity Immunoglobulin Gamma Fc Region Receptor Ii-A [Manis pentadactyla]|nr:Low Affinity Immunoglobulin Gamma Fc Region Receptor Ii-A [Manis pentadactyla]
MSTQQESALSPDADDHRAGQYCCSNWHPDAVMKLHEALLKKWVVIGNRQLKFKVTGEMRTTSLQLQLPII